MHTVDYVFTTVEVHCTVTFKYRKLYLIIALETVTQQCALWGIPYISTEQLGIFKGPPNKSKI